MPDDLIDKLNELEARISDLEAKIGPDAAPAPAPEPPIVPTDSAPADTPAEPAVTDRPSLASSLITPSGETRDLEGEGA